MQADRADSRIIEQNVDVVMQIEVGFVSHRNQVTDTEAPLLHRYTDANVAALQNEGNASLASHAAVLVGPKGNTIDVVDQTVAVRSDDRHVTRGLEQLFLQRNSGSANLRESGGVADGAASAHRVQFAQQGNRGLRAYADKTGIGCGR